jgi:hypothetical protein
MHAHAASRSSRTILNIVKFNIQTFFCYLVDVYTYRFPPAPSSKWNKPFYVFPRRTGEWRVPRHVRVSCTSAAFQFHHQPHDFALRLYYEIKLRFSNSLWTHWKLCISATTQGLVAIIEREIFYCSCKGTDTRNKEFCLQSVLDSHTFTSLSF